MSSANLIPLQTVARHCEIRGRVCRPHRRHLSCSHNLGKLADSRRTLGAIRRVACREEVKAMGRQRWMGWTVALALGALMLAPAIAQAQRRGGWRGDGVGA